MEKGRKRGQKRLCFCACVSVRLWSFPCVCSNVRRVCQGVLSGYVNNHGDVCKYIRFCACVNVQCAKGCGVRGAKGAERGYECEERCRVFVSVSLFVYLCQYVTLHVYLNNASCVSRIYGSVCILLIQYIAK